MVQISEGIAYAQLAAYTPILFCAAFIVFRQRLKKSSGWIYAVFFCGVKLSGAIFKIKEINHPTNSTDVEWAFILQSVGLSPLLLSSFGLLKRITTQIAKEASSHEIRSESRIPLVNFLGIKANRNTTSSSSRSSCRSLIIELAQVPMALALGLCVKGGIDETSSDQSSVSTGRKYLKIGIVVFVLLYGLLCLLTLITAKDVHRIVRSEKRLYFAIAAALPLLAVRLLYSILSAFSHWSTFSIQNGSAYVLLFMGTLEEFTVVFMYIIVGLLLRKRSKETTYASANPTNEYPLRSPYSSENNQDNHRTPGYN